MKRFRRETSASLQFKSMVILGSIYIPLIVLLLFSGLYSVNELKRKSYEMENQMIGYYIQNLDDRLYNLEDYLKSYTTTNSAIQAMAFPNVYPEKYELYKYLAYQELISAANAYTIIDYMYIYDGKQGKCYIAGKTEENYQTRNRLAEDLSSFFESGQRASSEWDCFLSEHAWLMRNIKYGDVNIGILLKADGCLLLGDYFSRESNVLLCNGEGRCVESLFAFEESSLDLQALQRDVWVTIDGVRYLQVHTKSEMGDFYLVGIIEEKDVYQNVPRVYLMSGILLLISILLIPICVILIRKEILKPIGALSDTMEKISAGNIEARVTTETGMAKELQIIYQSFNHMMDQIEFLQKELLEKERKEQRMKLQQLHYQIRPHFFLNSLNGIYGLAETGQNAIIQKMVLSLSEYFRFVFREDQKFVSLAEECRYVHSYAQIRKILQKDMLTVRIHLEEEAEQGRIPPFTIMTLVENSYKHGAVAGKPLEICVDVKKSAAEAYTEILVEDNGKGFSKEVLQLLKEQKGLMGERGEHTGIYNVCERLRFSYAEPVFVWFENREDAGARVRLKIPFHTEGAESNVSDIAGG